MDPKAQIRNALRNPTAERSKAQSRFALRFPGNDQPISPGEAAKQSDSREGAILIVMYPEKEDHYLLLTRRTETVNDHPGQISFPGGAREAGDTSLQETALRETEEELAIPSSMVEVVGGLPPVYIWASDFNVSPFVAWANARPDYQPNPDEVEEVLEIPLSLFHDPATIQEEIWALMGQKVVVPFYRFEDHKIWGATARMIRMLTHTLS